MKRTVRLLIAGLVLAAMLVSILAPVALAAPKWDVKPGKGPKIKFKDIEKNWARDYIEQMALAGVLKGVSDDKFAPDESVESVQILVMLVRGLGLEEKALEYQQDKETIRRMSGIPAWARGYVRVALEEGIITETEFSNLRPGQKATRLDAAKYISRLFDEEDDWWDNFDLPGLRDLGDLSDDLKVYIILVAKKGIMVGTPEGRWLPHNLLNRGQMAKIMSLILSRLANRYRLPQSQVYGEVVRVQTETASRDASITIKTDQDRYTYTVADNCVIRVDGKATELEDVTPGQRVWLTLAGTGGTREVVYIRAETPTETDIRVTGTISGLTLGQDAAITVITDGGRKITFQVDDETYISLDGQEVFLSDLRLEQQVTVKGVQQDKANIALEITAKSNQKEVSGQITAVVTKTPWSLSVKDNKGREHTFRITKRTTIRLNNKAAVLADLQPGDQIEVRAVDDEAILVEAQREEPAEKEIEGKITALVLRKDPTITIRTKAGRDYTYAVTAATKIRLDDKVATLDALDVGWEVELRVKGDQALNIWAESPPDDEERTVEGVLVQIRRGDKNYVKIEDEDGRVHEYKLDSNARFFWDEEEVSLVELATGLEVELIIRGGIVYEIRAED